MSSGDNDNNSNNGTNNAQLIPDKSTSFFLRSSTSFILAGTITILIVFLLFSIFLLCLFKRKRKSKISETKHHLLTQENENIPNSKLYKDELQRTIENGTVNKSKLKETTVMTTNEIPIQLRHYYYDNFDDIPFIDESRPTSVIDINRDTPFDYALTKV